MKWFPDMRRTQELRDFFIIVCGSAVLPSVLATFIRSEAAPSLAYLAYAAVPFFLLCAAVSVIVRMQVFREQANAAFGAVAEWSVIAGCVSLCATLLSWWTSVPADRVLLPFDALKSAFTLQILPFVSGPIPLVRFLPAVFAGGLLLELRQRRASFRMTLLWTLGMYAFLSVFLHAPTVIAALLAAGRSVSLASGPEAYSALVNAQVDGYWTMGQIERFLFSSSRQAEYGILLLHASILLLSVVLLAGWFVRKSLSSFDALVRRIATRGAGLFFVVLLIGVSIGFSSRGSRSSISDLFALLVFFVVAVAWVAWWRFRRDIDCVARDERERPNLPLPSGSVSVKDFENVCDALFVVVLFGSALLGWSMVLSVLLASIVSRTTQIPKILGTTVVAFSLGMAGLVFGLRQDAAEPWMTHLLMVSALVIGLAQLFRHVRDRVESRTLVALAFVLAMFLVLFIARSSSLVLVIVPFCAGMLWVSRKPSSWHKYGEYPFYTVLGLIAFFALFLPKMLATLTP